MNKDWKTFNDYEKGFLECFIDTDGGIYFHNVSGILYSYIRFYNNSKELLEKVINIIGTGFIKEHHTKGFKTDKKHYRIQYNLKDILWILPQLSLIIKEDKRIMAIGLSKNTKQGKKCDRLS